MATSHGPAHGVRAGGLFQQPFPHLDTPSPESRGPQGKPQMPPTKSLLLLGPMCPPGIPGSGLDGTQGHPSSLGFTVLSKTVSWGPLSDGRKTKPACSAHKSWANPQVPVRSGSCNSGLRAPQGSPSESNTFHIWDTRRVSPQCVSCQEKAQRVWGLSDSPPLPRPAPLRLPHSSAGLHSREEEQRGSPGHDSPLGLVRPG